MKKNLIYSVAFLLCGAVLFSSCEDMLEPDSNRVEYNLGTLTFNDSVYSVLGVLNALQKVGDKHILLGELRGDLVTTNDNTLEDIQDISDFEFSNSSNEYLSVKDYFAVINNCNLYLARVDTALSYNNDKKMMREFVAVKSVRAWTYMQLMKNHGSIPFFTDPVLTNARASEIMSATPADQLSVVDFLINDIAPYQDPEANMYKYHMPFWTIPGLAGTSAITAKLFMPIRVLLGDLYLWRASLKAQYASYPLPMANPNSDYAMAAKCYYMYLTEDNPVGDTQDVAKHAENLETLNPDKVNGYYPDKGFLNRFVQSNFTTQNVVAAIRYSSSEKEGSVSNLVSIFAPRDTKGKNQVEASPAIRAISNRQVYYRRYGEEAKYQYEVINSTKFPGDQRIYSVVASQEEKNDVKTNYYNNMIIKFNLSSAGDVKVNGTSLFFENSTRTSSLLLDRPENVYLRFAEALMGLEREGYTGAKELAMQVLKSGVKGMCRLYWQPDTIIEPELDADGEPIMEQLYYGKGAKAIPVVVKVVEEGVDEEGNPVEIVTEIPQYAPKMKQVVKADDVMEFDFTANVFNNNRGIHSRGSGFTERNNEYSLSDTCVAKHFGLEPTEVAKAIPQLVILNGNYVSQVPKVEKDADGEDLLDENGDPVYVLDENGNVAYEYEYKDAIADVYDITADDRIEFMYDKIIDEMALEMAFEGHRFGDLSRMATALDNVDFLARRVAARNVAAGDWRTAEGADGWNSTLYTKLSDRAKWYIPLPGIKFIEPISPEDVPTQPEDNTDDDSITEEGGDDTAGEGVVEGETTNP